MRCVLGTDDGEGDLEVRFRADQATPVAVEAAQIGVQAPDEVARTRLLGALTPAGFEGELAPARLDDGPQRLFRRLDGMLERRVDDRAPP